MKVFVNTFGTDIRLRQEVSVEPVSSTLPEVLKALRNRHPAELKRFITDELSPAEGSAILVNGRNILSLDGRDTEIHDGDELTFTVQVAGG